MSTITVSSPPRLDIRSDRDRLGRPITLRLDANECIGGPALPASPAVASAMVARYPDRTELERTIARRSGVDPARIVATAGGDDAIDRICRTVLRSGSVVVLTDPTFPMFRHFAEACGATVRTVPWLDGDLPIADLADAARGADLLALATPANPTGLVAGVEALTDLRAACPDPRLLLDLAYTEFEADDAAAFETIADAGRDLPRTVMVRTLSKAWGLAGLRVGWAEASPEFARRLRDAGGPFPIAVPSIAIATEVLASTDAERLVADRVRSVTMNRSLLAATVDELGLSSLESRANFLLVADPTGADRIPWLADGLAACGIAVRRFETGPIADRVRITVPVGEVEHDRVQAALRAVMRPDAILFDLDGVLADVSKSYRAAIQRTAQSYGVEIEPADIDRIKVEGDANDDWEVTRRLLLARGIDRPIAEIIDRFQTVYLGDGVRPGLRETESATVDPDALTIAANGRPIGIVTGRPRGEAEWFLRRSRLDRVVDVLVAREDAPLKPHPAGIQAALDRLDVAAAWFFGDTVDDIVAARAVGARCVVPIGVRPPGGAAEIADESDSGAFDSNLLRAGAARVVAAGDPLLALLSEVRP